VRLWLLGERSIGKSNLGGGRSLAGGQSLGSDGWGGKRGGMMGEMRWKG
jgi:hypothetical protein